MNTTGNFEQYLGIESLLIFLFPFIDTFCNEYANDLRFEQLVFPITNLFGVVYCMPFARVSTVLVGNVIIK